MGAASGSATVPASPARSPARSPGGSRKPECPKNALREPQTEANPTCRIQPPDGPTDARYVTPPLNPAQCMTWAPSMNMEATRRWIRTLPNNIVRPMSSDMPAGDKLLRPLLLEYGHCERPEGWGSEEHHSEVSFIDTMVVIHLHHGVTSHLNVVHVVAAAVGSLMILSTFMPEMRLASLVFWRCESSKYGGDDHGGGQVARFSATADQRSFCPRQAAPPAPAAR